MRGEAGDVASRGHRRGARSGLGLGAWAVVALVATRGCDDTTSYEIRQVHVFAPSYVAPGAVVAFYTAWGIRTTGQACGNPPDTQPGQGSDYVDVNDYDPYPYVANVRCGGAACELLAADGTAIGVSTPGDDLWFQEAAYVRVLEVGQVGVEGKLVRNGNWDNVIDSSARFDVVEPTTIAVGCCPYQECEPIAASCAEASFVVSDASPSGLALAIGVNLGYQDEVVSGDPTAVTVTPPVGLRCGRRGNGTAVAPYHCYVDATGQALTIEARYGDLVARFVVPAGAAPDNPPTATEPELTPSL